ncbi:hypothetical protein F2Q69_00034639 [Brassica cretica]|uniref:Uncharacterized protein n=1 Tax=Brassica cretica TaxID=69181 RepID=A0A8S9SJ96_BRACR|nr:hypothetical protein F2Q69_00034639 [Brassica cretica]
MRQCVTFTTWPDSREIVTLNCDVGIQSAFRKLVEMNPAASSVPERTAPQDSKKVIDMDKHLHEIGGEHSLNRKQWMIMMFPMNPPIQVNEAQPSETLPVSSTVGQCGEGETRSRGRDPMVERQRTGAKL